MVPLTALALGATYYSEYTYQQEVSRELKSNLTALSAEISRRLQLDRELAMGIAKAHAITQFLPILHAATEGHVPSTINRHRSRINHYFEGFQTILSGTFFMRILDENGNTLIKVSHNKRSVPVFESLYGLIYVEQEIATAKFIQTLRQLPGNEVSVLTLPHNQLTSQPFSNLSLLDYVVPLYYQGKFIGAVTLSLAGEHIDRIINHAPRIYQGKFLIVENNPDDSVRHSFLLYDDVNNAYFAQPRTHPVHIENNYGENYMETIGNRPDGLFTTENGHLSNYYVEMFPYPDHLISWIIISRIKTDHITAPFKRIRLGIWSFVGIAFLISLFLANLAARKIARPVTQLASNLLSYANNEHKTRVIPDTHIDEINDLGDAFTYMSNTLDHAREERDKAQHLMLQHAKLASVGQMAAGIGHEINNPLNNILSYVKLVRRNLQKNSLDIEPKMLRDLDSLRDEAIRATNIVKGILNFARQVPPQYELFPVRDWAEESIALVQQAAKTRRVTLGLQCEYQDSLQGDRAQLQQALINLLLNAIHASQDNGQVQTIITADDRQLCIRIKDEGQGITADELDNIFDPFFTTKPEGEGSGLGLSISLGIIENHEGNLIITNNTPHGVTATITLPLRIEHSDKQKDAHAHA